MREPERVSYEVYYITKSRFERLVLAIATTNAQLTDTYISSPTATKSYYCFNIKLEPSKREEFEKILGMKLSDKLKPSI
jgi:hypothetical protein